MEAREEGGAEMPRQSLSAHIELLERDVERAAVERLIAAAQAGFHLLALEGPPGIGKTALIAETKALGQAAGMHVLGGRGSELERSFSYGVVRQLFEPFLASLAADERAELYVGAAALAAPLFDPAKLAAEPAADSSLATVHGLYWLAANVAAHGRLLLTIDDLHWCDLPSLRWLAYLLPRIEGLDVWVVVGLRPGEPGADAGLLGQIVLDPLATIVQPAPLSPEAAAQLLRETLPEADDAFCAACHEETGGNPLLLRELVHAIVADDLAPTEGQVPRLRKLGARAGSRTVSLRLSRLPPDATKLARAVAILGDDADPRQAAALADLEDEAASEAAVGLARVDVLRPQPPFGFVHPLVRAAVYDALSPAERDSGHARAARLLEAGGAEPERVAAHLLLAPRSGDPGVVAVLREAARRAGSRGAAESAVAYLRRALAEPPPAAERAELLLELGSVEALVSGDAAIEHLREAHGLLSDPVARAEAALLLGHQLVWRGDESDAVLTQAQDELGGIDAELERLLEAALIMNALSEASLYPKAVERLERLRGRLGDTTVGEKTLLAALTYHDALAGAPAGLVVPFARRALAEGTLIREAPAATFVLAASVLAWADLDEAVVAYDDALAQAHRRGSIHTFAVAKIFRAQAFVWRGELAEAEADCREAFAATETWGTSWLLAALLAPFLADALMEQGKLEEAAAALARVESFPDTSQFFLLPESRARLRLLRGDLAGGVEELFVAGRHFQAVGGNNPAFLAWRSQAALALLQLGEQEEAAPAGGRGARARAQLGRAAAARRGPARLRPGRGRQERAGAARGGCRGARHIARQARARQGAHRVGRGTPPRQPPRRGARAAAKGP